MLKKKFLKTKCKVTFELPDTLTEHTETVYLVGDFNDWDERATIMEKTSGKRTGTRFSITLDLDLNTEYQYRYLVNGTDWHNDWDADRYESNPFSGDNSVVTTTPETPAKAESK